MDQIKFTFHFNEHCKPNIKVNNQGITQITMLERCLVSFACLWAFGWSLSLWKNSSAGEKIVIRGKPAYLLGSSEDLQPFADQKTVQDSESYILPDLGPVLPTIDFIKDHLYTVQINNGNNWSLWFIVIIKV